MTQLRDVDRWWRERARFRIEVVEAADGARIDIRAGERATVLVRDWIWDGAGPAWDRRWSELRTASVELPFGPRPFVGVVELDPQTTGFLTEQGYVVDESDRAAQCTIIIGPMELERARTRRALIEHIEDSHGPLIKLGRWPSGARSTFCFAGDLDALSLRDYARRIGDPFRPLRTKAMGLARR
jgi:hypothetical protein